MARPIPKITGEIKGQLVLRLDLPGSREVDLGEVAIPIEFDITYGKEN